MTTLPFLTAAIPSCGGAFKLTPEDFEVTELPAYEPSGSGEHLFIWIEKRGEDTPAIAKSLARALEIGERDVSYAGLKDRQALTRQLFCVPAKGEPRLSSWSAPNATLLWAKRHTNKLRTGHLRGNRFRLRLRGVTDFDAAERTLAVLAEKGTPNFFGAQRFGRAGDNAQKGRELLAGTLRARVNPFERKMFLSALQSELFNAALTQRLSSGTFAAALEGDVLRKEETGGLFVCEQPEIDQPRVDRFEVSPAGPMFGPSMFPSAKGVADAEARLLSEAGLSMAELERGGKLTEGTRRPYRIRLGDLHTAHEGDALVLELWLPSGAYATSVLRELFKRDG